MKGPSSYTLILSACFALVASACQEGSHAAGRIRFESLKSEMLTFEMCGEQFDIPRKRITQLNVDFEPGYSRNPKKQIYLPMILMQGDGDPSNLHEWVPGEIVCSDTPHASIYAPLPAAYDEKIEHKDLALEQFIYNHERLREFTYFRPLGSVAMENTFTIECLTLLPKRQISRCEIRGWVSKHIFFSILVNRGTIFSHWRNYKNFFETFIRFNHASARSTQSPPNNSFKPTAEVGLVISNCCRAAAA